MLAVWVCVCVSKGNGRKEESSKKKNNVEKESWPISTIKIVNLNQIHYDAGGRLATTRSPSLWCLFKQEKYCYQCLELTGLLVYDTFRYHGPTWCPDHDRVSQSVNVEARNSTKIYMMCLMFVYFFLSMS